MKTPTLFWISAVFILAVNSFSIGFCLTFPVLLFAFIAGLFTVLNLVVWNEAENYHGQILKQSLYFRKADLSQVYKSMKDAEKEANKPRPVLDKRLTGSREIDEPLQEVLMYIFQDYIYTWYNGVSDDIEFLSNVERSSQETIVSLVNRMKEIDWKPYLTTRLVDDVASHLRLYRQARTKVKEEKAKDSPAKKANQLEKIFFDLELAMEQKQLCRDAVCLEHQNLSRKKIDLTVFKELQYLKDVSEVLLFLLLPKYDFQCQPMRMLLRDLLAHSALLPLFDLMSSPDFINQIIVRLAELRNLPFTSDMLLDVLRTTDSSGELQGISEMLSKDIAKLRSCDLGLANDRRIKQQLSSLLYTKKIIDSQLVKLQEGSENDSMGLPSYAEWKQISESGPLLLLPLDELLHNNIALFYFISYMMSIGSQAYLYFYLNIEGWRASAEQQLSDFFFQKKLADDMTPNVNADSNIETMQAQMMENLKSTAKSICDQYLSEKASPNLKVKDVYYQRLLKKINNEFPSETWFDEIQTYIFEVLKTEDRFLPAFQQSAGYMKLLIELEFIKDPNRSDEDEVHLQENLLDNSSHCSKEDFDCTSLDSQILNDECSQFPLYTFKAEIIETGIANEHGNKYGVYCIAVKRHSNTTGIEKSWQIYRRYSDFLSLYQKIKDRHDDLGKLPFPSKKAFHSTERSTLEKRMRELNCWLQLILHQLNSLQSNEELKYPAVDAWMQTFLQVGDYEQQETRPFAKTVEQLFVKSFKSSLRTVGSVVRSVPETMSKAIHSRTIRQNSPLESSKVSASLDVETNDNIPLRIMLLLLDEVFDLKSRNQWLRRRIVNIVRQIVKSMFGDIVNRRILEYVSWLTSPKCVAKYIELFRDTFWPDGKRAHAKSQRTENDKMRMRVLAKMALLASMTDEIKRIMGSETTRRGLLLVFEMFQHPKLNRRLALVLFEGIIITLFPEHNFVQTFQKLHSLSERTQRKTS